MLAKSAVKRRTIELRRADVILEEVLDGVLESFAYSVLLLFR
jgi:hypothetical protein